MKVAIMVNRTNLERYTAPGAIPADWELIHLGNGAIDEEKIIATDADAILVDPMCTVSAKVINGMKHLKLIQSQGVGYNYIDIDEARRAGVFVANCAGANASAVAEQAVLLMLALLRSFRENEDMVFASRQIEAKTRCFENGLMELGDCHIGIIGMGAIGCATARLLKAFGSTVSYFSRHEVPDCGFSLLSLDELYAQCDIISLHVPVNSETIGMINNTAINKMKRGAIIINTARGEIVDQEAVCRALIDGRLGGYGTDTYTPEPVTPDNPLLALPPAARRKVALSPHIGGITAGSFYRYFDIIWTNMKRVSEGQRPVNIVNEM
ncbi:MAG: GyaR protein [Clostridiales bacterium]|jgi:phosphoglycerate dehydrogenase-like enzyme|nr:GyaR protein [Clostridiales bacterium]